MKTKKLIKLLILIPCLLVIIVTAAFFIAEEIMCRRISAALHREYGDNYAILRLHMGGVPAEKPSLWRMLNLAYEYRYSGNYEPEGSGNLTGKKNYLLLMLSDNTTVKDANWSFIDFDLDMSDSTAPWDVLDNLPENEADYYRYNPENRIRRRGLWFAGDSFNNPDTHFYYRQVAPDKDHLIQQYQSLEESGDLGVVREYKKWSQSACDIQHS